MPPAKLKHGTLALIVQGVPVFALATQPYLYDKMLSNIKEVKARDATVVALVNSGDYETEKSVDYALYIPKTHPFFTPILSVIPLQLFAYYAAKARGAMSTNRAIWPRASRWSRSCLVPEAYAIIDVDLP